MMWLTIIKESLRHWYLYLLSLIVCGLIGLLYYVFTAPSYSVSATLMVRTTEANSRSSQDELLRMMGYGGEKITGDEIEVLSSRYLMEQVIRRLDILTLTEARSFRFWQTQYPNPDLTVSYDSLSDQGVMILVRPTRAGYKIKVKTGYFESSSAFVSSLDEPISTHIGTIHLTAHRPLKARKYRLTTSTMPYCVSGWCRKIHISRIAKESKGIRLTTTSRSPQLSTDVLAALIETYNLQASEDKNLVADNTARFIDARLASVTHSLDSVEAAIQDYRTRYHISDLDKAADLYMRTNAQYDQMERDIATQLDVLDFIRAFVSDTANSRSLIPANLGIQDGTLNELIRTYNDRVLDFLSLARSATPDNPIYIRRQQEVYTLRTNIATSVDNVRSALMIRRNNLRSSGSAYSDRLESVPEQQRGYLELLRQQKMIEQRYLYLSQKQEENSLLQSSYALPARTIDPAQADPRPVSPRLSRIALAVLFFGLAIPFLLLALMCFLRDPEFRAWRDLEISR